MTRETYFESGVLFRSAILERSVDEKKRLVIASISSTTPYEREQGTEILSHAPGAVNLERVKRGACPFLLDHDTKQQIGKVLSVQLDGNRAVAQIKLSRSEAADLFLRDVEDGIKTEISIGYIIRSVRRMDDKKYEDGYLVTNWELTHVSSVAEPADPTVGIGRSNENTIHHRTMVYEDNLMETKVTTEKQDEAKKQSSDDNLSQRDQWTPSQKAEHRASEILRLGEQYNLRDEAIDAVRGGASVNGFRKFIIERSKDDWRPTLSVKNHDQYTAEHPLDPTGRYRDDNQEFSISRFIASQLPGSPIDASRENEVSRKLTREAVKSGQNVRGMLVPMGELQNRGLVVGTDTLGGNTVATNLLTESFIDSLHNRTQVLNMGASVLPGLQGDVAIPRQTGSATAYYIGENEAVTESEQSFDQITMSPYTVGARTTISRKMLLQSGVNIDTFIQQDLATKLALSLDLAAIAGTGSGQPTGILNTIGIGSVTGGDNGTAPTWADVLGLWSQVAANNADIESLSYLTNSKVIGKLMTTDKGADTGKYICEALPDAAGFTKLGGMRCAVSNQVPSNLDKGTSEGVCSAIIFGNWKDLLVGLWSSVDMVVDPYTDSAKGQVHITAFLSFDIAIRHAESFAAMTDALTA